MARTLSISDQYATGANQNAYEVDKLIYPDNLLDAPEYSGNKVVFFINVQSGAKRSGITPSEYKFKTFEVPDSDKNKFSGQQIVQQANGVVSSLGGGTPLAAAGMKRLGAAIALHMPNSLIQSTSVSWTEVDLFDSAKYLEPIGKVMNGEGGTAVAGAAAGAAAGAVIKNNSLYQRATRMTQGNSKAEMLFQSVGFRSFDFNYTFSPKSEKEADNVMNIIRMFKHHMLPEYFDKSEFLYVYPSEFDVKYYRGDKENSYIEKQITAVLTNLSIDYAVDGQFQTFSNGMASKMNLRLSFMETGVPTKETSPYNSHGV